MAFSTTSRGDVYRDHSAPADHRCSTPWRSFILDTEEMSQTIPDARLFTELFGGEGGCVARREPSGNLLTVLDHGRADRTTE